MLIECNGTFINPANSTKTEVARDWNGNPTSVSMWFVDGTLFRAEGVHAERLCRDLSNLVFIGPSRTISIEDGPIVATEASILGEIQ